MKQFLNFLDRLVASLVKNIITIFLIIVTTVVFITVIARYVFEVPIGGFGEIPIVLMILTVWLAGGINSRRDSHISIKILELMIKNKKVYHYINLIIRFLTSLSIFIFWILSWDYLKYSIESGDISPGLRFPQWWLISIVFISAMMMFFYSINNIFKEVKQIKEI